MPSAIKRWLCTLVFLLPFSFDVSASQPLSPVERTSAALAGKPGGELKTGRWVGYLKPDGPGGQDEAVALVMDTFLFQPDDPRQFPRIQALFQLSLGGYQTSEYETQLFRDIRYDFEQGILTLDDPENELIIAASVYSVPRIELEGHATLRSTGQTGTVKLVYQTDEPPDLAGGEPDAAPRETTLPFIPALAGQYEGTCSGQTAVLQLETGRGLNNADSLPSPTLANYAIQGLLGMEDSLLCGSAGLPENPGRCTNRIYDSASYDYHRGTLLLSSRFGTDECAVRKGRLTCRMRFSEQDRSCEFRKAGNGKPQGFKAYVRAYHVAAEASQKQNLPPPAPPYNQELVNSLRGDFAGYLHHERSDQYQPVRLVVNASTSSENPHNENDVFVSVMSLLHFGRNLSPELVSAKYDRRSFYLRPGFMLASDSVDSLLEILEWKEGYIRGNWFSKAYGRVGTFEVVKTSSLPSLPATARVVPSIGGEYTGPRDRERFNAEWLLRIAVPGQGSPSGKNLLMFQGESQLSMGEARWPRRRIRKGSYDLYTGAVAFLNEAEEESDPATLTMGISENQSELKLFWPGAAKWGVKVFDFRLESYLRKPE